ncbi:MAG: D-alanyl-D-alanine carboxypeptidase family protein [Eubacteriaceae bacterium]|nr:D-alanyl-D-alanine carboxypeptidase family protein [Eubacteriaceae bacterium]
MPTSKAKKPSKANADGNWNFEQRNERVYDKSESAESKYRAQRGGRVQISGKAKTDAGANIAQALEQSDAGHYIEREPARSEATASLRKAVENDEGRMTSSQQELHKDETTSFYPVAEEDDIRKAAKKTPQTQTARISANAAKAKGYQRRPNPAKPAPQSSSAKEPRPAAGRQTATVRPAVNSGNAQNTRSTLLNASRPKPAQQAMPAANTAKAASASQASAAISKSRLNISKLGQKKPVSSRSKTSSRPVKQAKNLRNMQAAKIVAFITLAAIIICSAVILLVSSRPQLLQWKLSTATGILPKPPSTPIKIAPGESYDFWSSVDHILDDPSDLGMVFSDTSCVTRPAFSKVEIKGAAQSGSVFTVKLMLGNESETFAFIVMEPSQSLAVDGIVANPESINVYINKERSLPETYEPTDLKVPIVHFSYNSTTERLKLATEAAVAAEELFAAASEEGFTFVVERGYEPYSQIAESFSESKTDKEPGHDEHQTGFSMSVSALTAEFKTVSNFSSSQEAAWLMANAYRYGFIQRYPQGKESFTGYEASYSQYRYVGKTLAGFLYLNNLTLDEFYAD